MAPPWKVLYLVSSEPSMCEVLRTQAPPEFTILTLASSEPSEIAARLSEADFVITVKMTAAMIRAAAKLKLIQVAGVGYEGIDLAAAAVSGIPVALTVEGTADAVAEHTILLILALYRRLRELDAAVRNGQWPTFAYRTRAYELQGKTVGLIGLGHVGREVTRRLMGFGVRTLYTDIMPPSTEVERELRVEFAAQQNLLRQADVVSLHVPLNAQTRHLIGSAELSLCKPSAILINTSRGEIVDEPALYSALVEGRLAGAGLDVLAQEPPSPDNPFLRLPQVLVTPHVAAGTYDSLVKKFQAAFRNMSRVLAGEQPLHEIRPSSLSMSEPKR